MVGLGACVLCACAANFSFQMISFFLHMAVPCMCVYVGDGDQNQATTKGMRNVSEFLWRIRIKVRPEYFVASFVSLNKQNL